VIPAGTLKFGDRVEIRFDYSHSGNASGFSFRVLWGTTTVLARDASAADALVTGRAGAAVAGPGAQLSAESWGSVLGMGTAVGTATDGLDMPLSIGFAGNLAQPVGDSITLSNFTVSRYSR
jgi:hypothetical protein